MRTLVFDSHDEGTDVTACWQNWGVDADAWPSVASRTHGFPTTNSMSNSEARFAGNPMETVSWVVLYLFKWRKFVVTRFCRKGVSMRAVLASLCCALDELIQMTRAAQHCTD